MEILAFILFCLLLPILFWGTDKLGWTAFYRKDRPHSIIGSAVLGAEHLFAQKDKQQAIEYRLAQKGNHKSQQSGDSEGP